MSGPVCPTCGGPFGNCSCYGNKEVRDVVVVAVHAMSRLRERAPEVRHWLDVVCLGLAFIVAGVVTLLV